MTLRPRRPPARAGSVPSWAFIVLLSLLIVGLLIWAGYTRGPGISGFGESVVSTETTHFTAGNKIEGVHRAVQTQNPRKVWDWIGLIGISAVIGAVGVYYTYRERKAQETAENQRAQDEALGAYLDQMSNLMIDQELRRHPEGADQWRLAQARTMAVLLGLDKDRKRRALKLLYELGLIQKGNKPHINLKNAGLDKADLSEITLHDADLSGANLSGATGVTVEELQDKTRSLRGATMPDGKKHA